MCRLIDNNNSLSNQNSKQVGVGEKKQTTNLGFVDSNPKL